MNALSRADARPAATPGGGRLVLDISRLLSRAGEAVPTGIDRVELAWAEHLLAHEAHRLDFAAIHPLGASGRLPFAAASRFVKALSRAWSGEVSKVRPAELGRRLLHGLLVPRRRRAQGQAGGGTYLLLSHQNLDRPRVLQAALARHDARLAAMVHDLIPLDYPEYCGLRQPARHGKRIDTVARLAHAVIVPSRAVREGLVARLALRGVATPVHVVPNGVHFATLAAAASCGPGGADAAPTHPYFVCLGTIEPRKNHALLLAVWRRLAATLGAAAPHLVLIGRRGWDCEHVHRLIDRTPGLRGLVHEHNSLADGEVVRLLRGARALLYPSFAEGFGLPVAEALALGVPVICSDIPPHREVGGDAPVYLDPTDGPGWEAAVVARAGRAPATAPSAGRLPQVWTPTLQAAVSLLDTGAGVGAAP